jgi:hypothetical protein
MREAIFFDLSDAKTRILKSSSGFWTKNIPFDQNPARWCKSSPEYGISAGACSLADKRKIAGVRTIWNR